MGNTIKSSIGTHPKEDIETELKTNPPKIIISIIIG